MPRRRLTPRRRRGRVPRLGGRLHDGDPAGHPVAKLTLMPLPLSAYGSQARTLGLDADESGVDSNADAASDSIATAGVARDLREARLDDPANGVTLVSSSRFAAPGLGDEGYGIRAQSFSVLHRKAFTIGGTKGSCRTADLERLYRTYANRMGTEAKALAQTA